MHVKEGTRKWDILPHLFLLVLKSLNSMRWVRLSSVPKSKEIGVDNSAFQTLPSGVHKIGVDFRTVKKIVLYIFFGINYVMDEFSKVL